MKELKLWKYILEKISNEKSVGLLIIGDSSNASPGRTGFKMAIAEDRTSMGTIGGGIMEYDLLQEVHQLLDKKEEICFYRKLHHNNVGDGDKSGLICGGYQTIIFKSFTRSDVETIQSIIENLRDGNHGLLRIDKTSFTFHPNKESEKDLSFTVANDNWVLEENIGKPDRVYIVGGGHVGLAVSRIMSTLNFYITVFDHRQEVATLSQNTFANEIIITPYTKISNHIIEGDKSYVVIVSPSHVGDKDALQAVLNLDLKYIGSMGSRKKIKSIFEQLRTEGFTESDLAKIHTPIGLEIEAETPEEIAISIAAEIIQIKNG